MAKQTNKPKKKPYKEKALESLPLWVQELVYEAATFNASKAELSRKLKKSFRTITRVIEMPNVQKAINDQKHALREPVEKQLEAIDRKAINRIEQILTEGTAEPSVIANTARAHLKGRGIYIEGQKIEESGTIVVKIESALVDTPAEGKK